MDFSNEERNAAYATPTPVMVILMLLLAGTLGVLIGSGLAYGWVAAQGMDFQNIILNLNEHSPLAQRNAVRMANLLNHLSSFTLPALIVVFVMYRNRWLHFLKLDRFPDGTMLLTSLFFIFASFPFIQIVLWVNQQIPLPSWLKATEQATDSMIKGLLVMDSPTELIFNLLIIAVLPAIGEELVFRGILQPQLARLTRRPVLAIWITAFLFGAIHMQAERLLGLMMLGAALGYVFHWSRSLWVPILGHFFINGSQVVAQYVTGGKLTEESQITMETSNWIGGVISLFLTIAIGYYLWSKSKITESPAIASAGEEDIDK